MKQFTNVVLGLSLLLFATGCDLINGIDDGGGDGDPGTTTVEVTGGGPVVQILPGPAVFAEEAQPTIEQFPEKLQQRFNKVAKMGPFSNNTAQISGDLSMVMKDRGASDDAVSGRAAFQSQDGTNWRFEFDRVNPDGSPPFGPHFGGVVTDFRFHGPTQLHTPLMALVQSDASMWGFARVFRNGELVKEKAPFHFMLTSRTRHGAEQNFEYICYTCSPGKPINQAHLISRTPPSMGPLYENAPGGFFHISWQDATFERTDPQ